MELQQESAQMFDKVKTWFNENYLEGRLPAISVQKFLASYGLKIDQLMLALLPIAQSFAVSPISKFCVGAVALGHSGAIYLGANYEFVDEPVISTIHAEQSAFIQARSYLESGIKQLAILHPPCGFCRQFLLEANPTQDLVIILPTADQYQLAELLPDSFSAEHLKKDSLFWKQPVVQLSFAHSLETDVLFMAAIKAAESSHAPYSQAYCGLALRLQNGMIIATSYLENAAFNPSVLPLEAALSRLPFYRLNHSVTAVLDVCLVQCEQAIINQASHIQNLLSRIAPQATFREYDVTRVG